MSNKDAILSCSRSFLDCLQPCSTGAKSVKGADWNILLTCFGSFFNSLPSDSFSIEGVDAKSAYIGDTCTSNTCARGTCAKNAFFAVGICIKGIGPKGISTKGASTESAYTGDTCIDSVGAVESSGVYLQFFQNLKV